MSSRQVDESAEIRVTYDADVCQHAAACVKGLPAIFNGDASPWSIVATAEPQAIADQVARCPSGALTFEMLTSRP